jgi:hypothetical protein
MSNLRQLIPSHFHHKTDHQRGEFSQFIYIKEHKKWRYAGNIFGLMASHALLYLHIKGRWSNFYEFSTLAPISDEPEIIYSGLYIQLSCKKHSLFFPTLVQMAHLLHYFWDPYFRMSRGPPGWLLDARLKTLLCERTVVAKLKDV